jgi:hypothetical protein
MIDTFNLSLMRNAKRFEVLIQTFILFLMNKVFRLINCKNIFIVFLMSNSSRLFILTNIFVIFLLSKVSRFLISKHILVLFSIYNFVLRFAFEIGFKLLNTAIKVKFTPLAVQKNHQTSKIYSLFLIYSKVYLTFVNYFKSILYEIENNFIIILNQLNKRIYSILNTVYISNKLSFIYICSSVQLGSFQPHFFTSSNHYDERI